MTEEKQSIGHEIYADSVAFGRIWAVVSAIFGTILSICILIVGISALVYKSHMKSVPAQVMEDSKCTSEPSPQQEYDLCKTKISYKVDNVTYTPTVNSGTTRYTAGTKVTAWYSPDSPGNPDLNPFPKWLGWVLIIIAILIFIGVWAWVWITRKSKFAAASGAVGQLAHLL